MRIYALGDIHGYLDKLEDAHARIAVDRARTGDDAAPVVHLGDLVDRGPDSRGVIEFLMRGREKGSPWVVLKGNHDQAFQLQLGAGVGRDMAFGTWMSDTMGGRRTAESYGIDTGFPFRLSTDARMRRALAEAVPDAHKVFLASLQTMHVTEDLVFVHAGIRPGLALSEQNEDDLLWIRRDFLDDTRDHGRLVVHGHTPVETPMHCGNRVNLDTGAGYGRALTAAVFEGRDVWVLDPMGDRVALPAP